MQSNIIFSSKLQKVLVFKKLTVPLKINCGLTGEEYSILKQYQRVLPVWFNHSMAGIFLFCGFRIQHLLNTNCQIYITEEYEITYMIYNLSRLKEWFSCGGGCVINLMEPPTHPPTRPPQLFSLLVRSLSSRVWK